MYDQNSFLQGIAVGKALKGWNMVGGGTGYVPPSAWTDQGVYSYFYLNYQYPIDLVSTDVFKIATKIQYKQSDTVMGYITPSKVEQFNETTFKVYADLSNAKDYVIVTGVENHLLSYKDGNYVPYYTALMIMTGESKFVVLVTDELEYDREQIAAVTDGTNQSYYREFVIRASDAFTYDRSAIKEMGDDLSTKI